VQSTKPQPKTNLAVVELPNNDKDAENTSPEERVLEG